MTAADLTVRVEALERQVVELHRMVAATSSSRAEGLARDDELLRFLCKFTGGRWFFAGEVVEAAEATPQLAALLDAAWIEGAASLANWLSRRAENGGVIRGERTRRGVRWRVPHDAAATVSYRR